MSLFIWRGDTATSVIGILPITEGYKMQLQSIQVSVDMAGYWFDPGASFTPTVSVTIQRLAPTVFGILGLGQRGYLEKTVIAPSSMMYDTVSNRATVAMPYLVKNNFKDIEVVDTVYISLEDTLKAGWTSTVGVILEYQLKKATDMELVTLKL